MSDIEQRLRRNSDWRDERWRCITDPALLIEAADIIARLRDALEPFAQAAASYDPDEGDSDQVAWAHDFTIGALRRARAALKGEG